MFSAIAQNGLQLPEIPLRTSLADFCFTSVSKVYILSFKSVKMIEMPKILEVFFKGNVEQICNIHM